MAIEITWYGHGTWGVTTGSQRIVIDPFFDGNPSSPVKAAEVNADYLLVSHGHGDHVGDAASIAHRCGATVVCNYEISLWLAKHHGVTKAIGMNLGGAVSLPWGRAKMTLAFHSSELPDGSNGGNPCGWLLELPTAKIYFACDTALFGDMKLIGAVGLDLAVLPIGDLYTMGPDDALAAVKLLQPKRVAASHFNTWPPIAQDANTWAERVRQETSATPCLLQPGGKITL